jgi:hypothetical protein
MNNAHLPPAFVSTPVPVAYAYDVDDAVLVTMIRLLGLCWNCERTPTLPPDELAEAVGRSRSALYRHLQILKDDDENGQNPGCLRWIQVEQVSRCITIRPLVKIAKNGQLLPDAEDGAPPRRIADDTPPNGELYQALRTIGIENPKREQLARQNLDPRWVYAWDLWARHPHRQHLTNPVGYVILKLESGERPPGEFLREAAYRPAPATSLRDEAWRHRQGPAPEPEPEERPAPSAADRLWALSLEALHWQMKQATFDAWLCGSRVLAVAEDRLTIGVRDVRAVEWLEKRLMPVVKRTVHWHAGREIEIAFTTLP